jgi:hypothetical protein
VASRRFGRYWGKADIGKSAPNDANDPQRHFDTPKEIEKVLARLIREASFRNRNCSWPYSMWATSRRIRRQLNDH